MEITKENIIHALEELPVDRLGEVLDFVMFLSQRTYNEHQQSLITKVKAIPADHLKDLVGLVAWGGMPWLTPKVCTKRETASSNR